MRRNQHTNFCGEPRVLVHAGAVGVFCQRALQGEVIDKAESRGRGYHRGLAYHRSAICQRFDDCMLAEIAPLTSRRHYDTNAATTEDPTASHDSRLPHWPTARVIGAD